MKRILITGAGSYIGESVKEYLQTFPHLYEVAVRDTVGWEPVPDDFRGFDVVFHAAGIAHVRETKQNRHLYYRVNRDLAVRCASAAKKGGVKQFILLSTMSVYGLTTGHITKDTPVHPVNAYGKSKAQADAEIAKLADDTFLFTCLRPPMVYGKGCRGNYQSLRTFALRSPVFPDIRNRRSMIYIGNLCAFAEQCIAEERAGLFFPQNAAYTDTSEMVRLIAKAHGRTMRMTKLFNGVIRAVPAGVFRKVFGSLTYEKTEPVNRFDFEASVRMTEQGETTTREAVAGQTAHAEKGEKKKALLIASMASNLDNFNRNNIDLLVAQGYDVTLASNFRSAEDTNSADRINAFAAEMRARGIRVVQIDFYRRVSRLRGQIRSFQQVRDLIRDGGFHLIHCHSPICAAMTRICAKDERRAGRTKVIYTAHGFHFYRGASPASWMLYYPVEKALSRETDVLITINLEDYRFAKRRLHAKKTSYIPGVGVDTERFAPGRDTTGLRAELGIPEDALLCLSVGELNRNKNHETVLRALTVPDMPAVYYVIVGEGARKKALEKMAASFGIGERVRFTGYRPDVIRFYRAADVFVFPSFREGLPVALMEAMSCGLPVICSAIRGNTDLVDTTGGYLFDPGNAEEAAGAIRSFAESGNGEALGAYNRETMMRFDARRVSDMMKKLYADI
ncbi:MAG: glycosyltransferase [Lachnospiraceae bacterium]|nr:glycosyltransferase [Lachnospiraceae bacterium]